MGSGLRLKNVARFSHQRLAGARHQELVLVEEVAVETTQGNDLKDGQAIKTEEFSTPAEEPKCYFEQNIICGRDQFVLRKSQQNLANLANPYQDFIGEYGPVRGDNIGLRLKFQS